MCGVHLTEILIHYLRIEREQPGKGAPEEIGEDTPGDVITRRAVSFIHDHYAEAIDLGSIAKAIGKSDRYIRRHFDEFLGVSPMRYLLRAWRRKYRSGICKDVCIHPNFSNKI